MGSASSSQGHKYSWRLSDIRSGHRFVGLVEDTWLLCPVLVDDCGEAEGGACVEDLLHVHEGHTYRTTRQYWLICGSWNPKHSFSLLAMTPCVDWKALEIEACSVAPNVLCVCDVWMAEGASVFSCLRVAWRDYQMRSNYSRWIMQTLCSSSLLVVCWQIKGCAGARSFREVIHREGMMGGEVCWHNSSAAWPVIEEMTTSRSCILCRMLSSNPWMVVLYAGSGIRVLAGVLRVLQRLSVEFGNVWGILRGFTARSCQKIFCGSGRTSMQKPRWTKLSSRRVAVFWYGAILYLVTLRHG
jgi:hypothetical protein